MYSQFKFGGNLCSLLISLRNFCFMFMQTYAYAYDFRFLSCIYSHFAGLLLEAVYYCVIWGCHSIVDVDHGLLWYDVLMDHFYQCFIKACCLHLQGSWGLICWEIGYIM